MIIRTVDNEIIDINKYQFKNNYSFHHFLWKRIYNIDIPKTKKGNVKYSKTKQIAEDILANKLCRCIKKVDKSTKKTNPTPKKKKTFF